MAKRYGTIVELKAVEIVRITRTRLPVWKHLEGQLVRIMDGHTCEDREAPECTIAYISMADKNSTLLWGTSSHTEACISFKFKRVPKYATKHFIA